MPYMARVISSSSTRAMPHMQMPEIHTLPPEGILLRGEAEVVTRGRATRRSHWFYLALASFVALIAASTIARMYLPHRANDVKRSWLDQLYILIVLGWTALLVMQVALVHRGERATHRKLGLVGVGYALLVLSLGLVATFVEPVLYVERGDWNSTQAASFILLPIGDLLLFAIFFAASIALRHRRAVHKRLMILASIALLLAPIERTMAPSILAIGLAWLSPLMLSIGYDLWRHRRVHPVNLVGGAVLALSFTRVLAMDSENWLLIGRAIITALLPVAGHGV